MARPTEIDEAEAIVRAARCWELMDKNERTAVRIGMSPLWVLQANLGGKAPAWEGFEDITKHRHAGRLLTRALFACAKEDGGMIA